MNEPLNLEGNEIDFFNSVGQLLGGGQYRCLLVSMASYLVSDAYSCI